MTDTIPAAKPPRPAGPFSSWEIGLAFRYLRARRKDGGIALIAIISYVAITLAVLALITVMSIMAGFRSELLSRMLSFNGHMYVQGQVLNSPDRDAAVTRLKALPGVVSVTPLIESQSLLRAGGQTTGAVIRGLRPADLDSMSYVYKSLTPEARAAFGQGDWGGNNVLIGKSLADQLGVIPGDPITLYSPSGASSAFGNLGGLEKTYTVGGVFSSGTADFDRAFVFMPLEQAQLFFGKEGIWDVIEMKVADPDNVAAYLDPVRQAAGPGSKNKTRDIAILRTVGASQGSMMRVFFVAGAAIGIAGTLSGLFLGLVFCLNIGAIQHFLEGLLGVSLFNQEVYMLDAIPALVDPVDVFWVAIWSLFMSCVASLLPSWQAAKLDPVEALRFE